MTNVPTEWLKANREKHPPKEFISKLMLMLKLLFQYNVMPIFFVPQKTENVLQYSF